MNTFHYNEPEKQHKLDERRRLQRQHPLMTIKELLLVALVAILAGLSIYISQDNHTSFGLLSQVAYADVIPVITSFRTGVLTDERLLDLQIRSPYKSYDQVEGFVQNPSDPPPLESFTALNTRVGGEIGLYWTLPDTTLLDNVAVNVYRKLADESDLKEQLVVERSTETAFVDGTVKNGSVYMYRAVTVAKDEKKQKDYESKESLIVTVVPSDQIPPQAPTEVTVLPVVGSTDGQNGLMVEWTNPTDEDFDHSEIYRSTVFGDRGDLLVRIERTENTTFVDPSVKPGDRKEYTVLTFVSEEATPSITTVDAADSTHYLDQSVLPNVHYYYTIVAYDDAGNSSSDDFQVPAAGNDSPFEPLTSATVAEEEVTP